MCTTKKRTVTIVTTVTSASSRKKVCKKFVDRNARAVYLQCE